MVPMSQGMDPSGCLSQRRHLQVKRESLAFHQHTCTLGEDANITNRPAAHLDISPFYVCIYIFQVNFCIFEFVQLYVNGHKPTYMAHRHVVHVCRVEQQEIQLCLP